MENIELPKDFIEVTKENTDYKMPDNYNSEFISDKVLDWHMAFYKANGLGIYLGGDNVDIMKPVHLYKDMFIK